MTKRKGVQGIHHDYIIIRDTRTPSGTPASRGHWVDAGVRDVRCPKCGRLMRLEADRTEWMCWVDGSIVYVRAAERA